MSSILPLLRFTIVYHAVVSTVAADAAVMVTAMMPAPTSAVATATARPSRHRRGRRRSGCGACLDGSWTTFIAFLSLLVLGGSRGDAQLWRTAAGARGD